MSPASPCRSSKAHPVATEDRAGLRLGTGTSVSPRGTRRSPRSRPWSASGFQSQVSLKARSGEEGIPPFQESSQRWGPTDAERFPLLHPNSFLTESAMESNMAGLFIEVFLKLNGEESRFKTARERAF